MVRRWSQQRWFLPGMASRLAVYRAAQGIYWGRASNDSHLPASKCGNVMTLFSLPGWLCNKFVVYDCLNEDFVAFISIQRQVVTT